MPKVSIITTTYKHQDFISQTIESILSQTFTDWELLIWDDSPDNETWNIIQEYVDKYPDKIKAWHHSPNKWIVNNVNFLLEKVSIESEYIAFLEGDDMFTNDNLSEKIEIFNKYWEVWVVTSWVSFINKFWDYIKSFSLFTPEYYQKYWLIKYEIKNMLLLLQPPIRSFWNVMIKKELLKYINNIDLWIYKDEKIFIPYDFIFWLNIFPKTKVYNSNKKLFKYRFHNNNNSDPKNFKKWLMQVIFVINMYNKDLPKETKYISNLLLSKINALDWKILESINYLMKSIFIFPLKHKIYKLSIILDIMKIKNILVKFLIILWFKK